MFNKLNVPIINGNKKQREAQTKAEALEVQRASIALVEWQIDNQFILTPYIQSIANDPEFPTEISKIARFRLVKMDQKQLDDFKIRLKKYKEDFENNQ